MDSMKTLLQKNLNDMVDIRRDSSDNWVNTRGLERPPLRRPYQDTKNQPPLNPSKTVTFDEIYSIFNA